jgi:hypothetical protein
MPEGVSKTRARDDPPRYAVDLFACHAGTNRIDRGELRF